MFNDCFYSLNITQISVYLSVIFNTTHTNRENEEIINDLIGKKYSFLEAIKLGGVGSKRMIVEQVSVGFNDLLNTVSDINYGNIELRKNGILVHITKGLQNFSWAIPYYQLHIYKTGSYSIHAQGNFVRFKKNKLYQENKKFLDRLLDKKIENEEQYDFYNAIR